MLRKIFAVVFVMMAFVVSRHFANYYYHIFDLVDYLYFPFPIKVNWCGGFIPIELGGVEQTCQYPYIWWGIAESAIFWTITLAIAWRIGFKKKIKI